MTSRFTLGDIVVDVTLKDIKNVHLSVYPPTGSVRIAAPRRMSLDTVRVFAISKLDWIREAQAALRAQERETPREYAERESHYVWGKRYLLSTIEAAGRASVALEHRQLRLQVPPATPVERREAVLERWYREQVKKAVPSLLAQWEPVLGVRAERFYVQRMKTKWGSCNHDARTIRLNTDLAKKPPECLEYIVVHELAHLIEPTHNARFVAVMNRYLPRWQHHRAVLNRLPIRQESWSY
jgi:predicted metal-dependent hydrolase